MAGAEVFVTEIPKLFIQSAEENESAAAAVAEAAACGKTTAFMERNKSINWESPAGRMDKKGIASITGSKNQIRY